MSSKLLSKNISVMGNNKRYVEYVVCDDPITGRVVVRHFLN